MFPSFDIFKIDPVGNVLWRDAAESLVAAKMSVDKLTAVCPGEYLIFNQKTQQKVLVGLPVMSAQRNYRAFELMCRPA